MVGSSWSSRWKMLLVCFSITGLLVTSGCSDGDGTPQKSAKVKLSNDALVGGADGGQEAAVAAVLQDTSFIFSSGSAFDSDITEPVELKFGSFGMNSTGAAADAKSGVFTLASANNPDQKATGDVVIGSCTFTVTDSNIDGVNVGDVWEIEPCDVEVEADVTDGSANSGTVTFTSFVNTSTGTDSASDTTGAQMSAAALQSLTITITTDAEGNTTAVTTITDANGNTSTATGDVTDTTPSGSTGGTI